ncbi:LEM domain-containing protein 1 isoform X3 [Microcaecilia unicolor]|uniref:LEM domain-containing protein 1 isoform X3 n=1 Tax=Microcaecilia unicolor TaxID=1415580 RepID=A0A6P7ZQM5_9AMPH|nr:LEM domain-containing protein 1 isoform X3 [Microcaecilia unicolor]
MSVLDVKSLTNSELKEQLLKRGIRSGPILPTTRNVYEKKLLQMLDQGPLVPQVKQNGTGDVDQYSDSEEEGLHLDNGTTMKSDAVTAPGNTTSSFGHSKIEKRSSSYKRVPENSPQSPQSTKQDYLMSSKNAMNYRVAVNTPKSHVFNKHSQLQTSDSHKEDVLTELFPRDTQPPLGMSATRRRPIKGAAGRPIQFKYEDTAAQVKLMEQVKVEVDKSVAPPRLLTASLQIVVFAIMVFFILVFFTMESTPDNPFTSLIEKVEVHQAP